MFSLLRGSLSKNCIFLNSSFYAFFCIHQKCTENLFFSKNGKSRFVMGYIGLNELPQGANSRTLERFVKIYVLLL